MKPFATLIFSLLSLSTLHAQQLVAYYPFNLSTNDQTPHPINPTYVGPFIDYDDDRFGRTYAALKFDGNTGSYLRLPADSLPTGNRTISLWFKAASVTNRPQLLAYGGNSPSNPPGTSFLMGLNTSGSGSYQTSAHYNTNVVNYPYLQEPINMWTHWVVVIEGNTTRIFINGELKAHAPGSFTSPTVVAGKDFALGVMVNANGIAPYTDVNGGYFRGLMDDVRLYDGAMTDQQVAQLYKLESTGLVAYYPFNGNANDESGNGNHGVVNGAALTADRFGNPDKAYRFNQPNHIQVSNSNLFSDEFSVSYWFKVNSFVGERGVMSNVATPNGGFQQTFSGQTFNYITGYNFTGGFNPNVFTSSYATQEQPNTWHHAVLTYKKLGSSGSESKLYINGELKKADMRYMPIAFTPNAPLFFGQNHGGVNFEGDLDEIRIYNRLLNANEIRQLADFPMMPDLLAWLPLNGHVDDVSSNGHYGSVYGNATPTQDRYGNNHSAYYINGPDAGISLDISNTMDFVGQPFSLSAWVKYSDITGPPSAVVSKHNCGFVNGYLLGIYENIPRFFLASGAGAWSMLSAHSTYNDNRWHHLVATYDGVSRQQFFVDGQLQESANVQYDNPAGLGAPILIGDAAGSCAGETFQCAIDDFKIYAKDLDTMQVKALFRQSRGSGNALSFLEASQTSVDLDTTIIGDEFTLEAWAKTPGFEGPQFVIRGGGNDGSWAFGMQNEKLILRQGNNPVLQSSTVQVYNNQWHYIAATVKNNQYTLYFDGSPVGNGNTAAQTAQASRYFLGQSLNGTMDEVRIWKKGLTVDEMRQWMNRKITAVHPKYVDLQHYYTFDEPNLTKAIDVREEQTGMLINNPQYGPSGAPIGDTAMVSFNPVGTQGVELVAGGDSVKISGWVGSPTGLAVYAVKDVPANTKGTQGLGGNDQYFGTKSYGGALSIVQLYKYGNNPMVSPAVQPTVALFYRENNASCSWGPGTEVNHNPAIKQFFSPGPEGEWILGSTGIPLEIKELSFAGNTRDWTVYPNPVSETLFIKGFQAQAILTLRDVAGREVMAPTLLNKKQGLSVSHLKPGLYFLDIQEGKQRFAAKVLIQQH